MTLLTLIHIPNHTYEHKVIVPAFDGEAERSIQSSNGATMSPINISGFGGSGIPIVTKLSGIFGMSCSTESIENALRSSSSFINPSITTGWIEAILTVKRASVEGNKRCHACAIHTYSMSAKSYKNRCFHLLQFTSHKNFARFDLSD